MVGPLGVVVSPFRPTSRIEGHFEAARRDLSARHGKTGPWERPNLVPIRFPCSPLPPSFTVNTFIEGCSRSDAAADFLRSLPTTGGSVPSPLGARGAGVHAVCGGCSSSSSLSYSAGPVSFSFSTESSALVYGLEWCHSHLESCHFQSALFLATPGRPSPFSPRPQRFSNRSPSGVFGISPTPSPPV